MTLREVLSHSGPHYLSVCMSSHVFAHPSFAFAFVLLRDRFDYVCLRSRLTLQRSDMAEDEVAALVVDNGSG
eukprot:4663423-Pleurochrysis_carterae.AAC.13